MKRVTHKILFWLIVIATSLILGVVYFRCVMYRGWMCPFKWLEFFIEADGERAYNLMYWDAVLQIIFSIVIVRLLWKGFKHFQCD